MCFRWALFFIVAFYHVHVLADATGLPSITFDRSYDYLNGYLEVYDDKTKQLDLEDVLNLDSSNWEIVNENVVNRKIIDAIIWLHFKIDARNLEADFEPRQLIVNYVLLSDVKLFTFSQTQVDSPKSSSLILVDHKTPNAIQNSNIFDLPVALGVVNDYYIRVDAQNMSLIPVLLMTKEERAAWSTKRTMYSFFYYGAMSIMVIFFLFLFLRSKDRLYFFFAVQIASVTAYNVVVDGYATQIFLSYFNMSPSKFAGLFALINVIFTCFFTGHFLEAKERIPKVNFSFKIIMIFACAMIVLIPFISPLMLVQIIIITTAFQSPLLVGSSLWVYFKGYKEVRYLALGVSIYVSFSCVLAWSFEGVLPWSNITPYYLHIGSAFLAVFVSIALIDRFNKLREEKLLLERTAKQQLEDLNADLLKSNQLKDEFLSTISHELRTPMNGVLGALELMKEDNLTEQSRNNYAIANQSAQEMIRLVDDLLCLSELNGNEKSRTDVTFYLPDIKHFLSDNFRHKSVAKGIEFNIEIAQGIHYWLSSDVEKLKNILSHLIDNGIKFTEKGGVEVKIDCQQQGNNKGELVFSVRDTGIGIEQDKLDVLFEAFKQGDSSFSRRFSGLGIGMAICMKMIESLEGNIQINSTVGEGTEIKGAIPVVFIDAPKQPSAEIKEIGIKDRHAELVKALIVEDNLVNQKVLAGILKKLNVETVLANNGLEGAELCDAQNFDIVFMDCQMPVMDGFDSSRRIRSDGSKNPSVPIIAVTANATANDKQQCFSSGMNDFLKKPIKKDDIQQMLDKHTAPRKIA